MKCRLLEKQEQNDAGSQRQERFTGGIWLDFMGLKDNNRIISSEENDVNIRELREY